jgi:anti-anti-sigma regulatory factor
MFKLPAQLTIAQVGECKEKLLVEINNNNNISFDDSDVTIIDTVGVQLLLAAVTYIALQNKELNWNSTSSVIQKSVKQLGLNEAILDQYLNVKL